MSNDYNATLDAVAALLASAAPTRVVTREYKDFADRDQDDLRRGIYTIQPAGVGEYPEEFEPGDLGRLEFVIVGQGQLEEDASGVDIDRAEFAMLAELEAVAANHYAHPETVGVLQLLRANQSGQLERPYYWVVSHWKVYADNEGE